VRIRVYLQSLVKFLKFGVPMGKAIGEVYDEEVVKQIEPNIELLEEISKQLPMIDGADSMQSMKAHARQDEGQQAVGPALRALYSFLKKVDPDQKWGGLAKTITPDGNILWLCARHRQPYEPKPLVMNGL
jgi:internalin A